MWSLDLLIICLSAKAVHHPSIALVHFRHFSRNIEAHDSLVYWCMHASLSVDESTPLGLHYSDVIMGVMASQITSLTIVHSTVYSGADQRKYQSSTSLAFLRGIHQSPVNSQHKEPVMQKMFPFDDTIMTLDTGHPINCPMCTTQNIYFIFF